MRLGPLENHSRHFAVTLEMVIDHAIRQPHAASMTGIWSGWRSPPFDGPAA
jgi:hypothetical protein